MASRAQPLEDDGVTTPQLLGREPAAERVAHVRIRARLVKHDVAAAHRFDDGR